VSNSTEVTYLANCVSKGMVLRDGKLYHGSDKKSQETGLLCTAAQFDENDLRYLSGDALMREVFSRLSARMDELSEKVDAIYEEVMPKMLDKPVIKKPGPQP